MEFEDRDEIFAGLVHPDMNMASRVYTRDWPQHSTHPPSGPESSGETFMRFVLELIKGSGTGQRRLLRAGYDFCVGRSEFADFSCSDDDRMSREHFRLRADNVGCLVEDLGSRNGTLVNDQPIRDRVLLKNDDQIRAGNNVFRVTIEDDDPDAAQTRHSTSFMPDPETAVVLKGLGGRLKGEFTAEVTASGLHLFTGSVDAVSPAGLAELLSHDREAYVIVDPAKSGIPVSDLPLTSEPVFDFLEPGADSDSPVIVSAYEAPGWTNIVRDAWGQDALVILLSSQDKEVVIPAIRQSLRPQPKESSGIVGICWPSVLWAMLSYDQSGALSTLLEMFETVILEPPDLPDTWHVFSTSDLTKRLRSFGLKAQELQPVQIDNSSEAPVGESLNEGAG